MHKQMYCRYKDKNDYNSGHSLFQIIQIHCIHAWVTVLYHNTNTAVYIFLVEMFFFTYRCETNIKNQAWREKVLEKLTSTSTSTSMLIYLTRSCKINLNPFVTSPGDLRDLGSPF